MTMEITDAPSSSKQYRPEKDKGLGAKRELSLSSLILWNIQKVYDKNTSINLKEAIKSASDRLDRECDVKAMLSQQPEDQHLACAVLAWQRLGHSSVESLYRFVEINRNKAACSKENKSSKYRDCYQGSECKGVDTSQVGPVVRLPVETKIVMRMENPCSRHQPKKPQKNQKDIINKIDAACCMDSSCMQRLTELGASTEELRKRAGRLARREAERVELLERAEAAWRDLEAGYQRRLKLAEEKEADIANQINKLIEDRAAYKDATTALVQKLKEKEEVAEKERNRLTQLEKDVCNKACERLRLSEQAAQGDASVAEQQCRAVQLDRELLYKEEQARRKILSLESEVDSTRGLTIEAERAMRSELSALKDQITDVSKQLLVEEASNNQIKAELEDLRQEKAEMINDLDGCKDMCDNRMQKRIDVMKNKKDQLMELKNRVIECQCKLPLDVAVEVKRTPSLAALCHCVPEDRILDSCSCVSLRSQLLSNLLSDLFSGLQAEMSGTGTSMPCQLLKCLEDRHNWDRATVVKTNLRNYFAQLLIGELDIAIATSIEKYHAKWVGSSCADQARPIPDPGEDDNEGWQERAIERRAQILATKLAEQLFKERADKITQKAKDMMTSGPPPCQCKPQHNAAVYPCLVKAPIPPNASRKTNDGPSTYLKRTIQNVTNLKYQIEDLKKDSIKKEDLRQMEEKIAKIIQRASKQENKQISINSTTAPLKKDIEECKNKSINKINTLKKTQLDINNSKKSNKLIIYNQSGCVEKSTNKYTNKKKEQALAVNLCLCTDRKDSHKAPKVNVMHQLTASNWKPKLLSDITTQVSSSIRLSKPITHPPPMRKSIDPFNTNTKIRKNKQHKTCPSDCICFHKPPSNTSIDKLLEALKTWKNNLDDQPNLSKQENNSYDLTKTDSDIDKHLEHFNNVKKSINENIAHSLSKTLYNDNNYRTLTKDEIHKKRSNECLAFTTHSEYMGAVNLEKSNNDCNCAQNSLVDSTGSLRNFKCINTSLCKCVELSEKDSKLENSFCKISYEKPSQLYSVKLPNSDNAKSNLKNEETNVGQNDSFISKIVKDSQLFSSNCDYDIKFLGATLYNISKKRETTLKGSLHEKLPFYEKKASHCLVDGSNNIISADSCVDKDNNELKFNSKINVNGTNKNGEDKCSASVTKILKISKESCICCRNKDEITELEVNAFNLLKEYLRGKLDQFKSIKCQSSCIGPEDEEKLYSTILTKVKDLILKSTDQLSCKCWQENNTDGSWSRAYSLLQEYLRIKICRVQCSCLQSEKTTNEDRILPTVLERVSHLIENDFQRLKDLCVCKTENSKKNSPTLIDNNNLNVHFDCHDHSHLTDYGLRCAREDMSILANPSMINKSCSALDSIPAYVQMVEKVTSCKINSLYVTDCDCRYTLTEPCLLGDNINVNNETNIFNNKSESVNSATKSSIISTELGNNFEQKFPYIGYTLNCSCDHFGCVCTKSQLETNDERINFIWNSLPNDNHPKNLSYIMRAVPRARSEHIYIPENYFNVHVGETCRQHKNSDDKQESNSTPFNDLEGCVTQTSIQDEEGLVLKDSVDDFEKTNNDTNTVDFSNKYDDPGPSCHSSFVTIPNTCDDDDVVTNKNTLYNSLFLPVDNCLKSHHVLDTSDINISKSVSQCCECSMVPLCHVKMLVNNIETNLKNCKCTCDSLSSQVCPVHSKKNVSQVKF